MNHPTPHRASVLAAGDHFVTPTLLTDALYAHSPVPLEIRSLTLPWPDIPFATIAEVDEASGTEQQLIDALQGVSICVTQLAPLTQKVLTACPELELFCITRGGPVNANLEAAARHGVAVCSAPGRNATATAEHTVAMMLAAMRRIPQAHAELLTGTWRGDYYRYDSVGLELCNRTVGLVGYGAIGSRVAKIVEAFGATVLVHDPYVDETAISESAETVGLDDLFARSQIVSLHARLTAQTRGLVNRDRIAAMPPGSVLVNCARGQLVDYDAVCDALDSGHLFAAAFDVFPAEPPPPNSRVLHTPGIVVTPHLAGASQETAHKAAEIAAREVGRYLAGEPLQHCVNQQSHRPI